MGSHQSQGLLAAAMKFNTLKATAPAAQLVLRARPGLVLSVTCASLLLYLVRNSQVSRRIAKPGHGKELHHTG